MPKLYRYFAYGSNILQKRLEQRVGKVNKVGTHKLYGFKLIFNFGYPKSVNFVSIVDASKKDFVEGVIYELSAYQRWLLDYYEGLYAVVDFKKDNLFTYIGYNHLVLPPAKTGRLSLDYVNILLDGCLENNLIETYNIVLDYKMKNFKLPNGSKHKPL